MLFRSVMKAKRILVGLTALAAATMSVPVFAQAKGADAGPWKLGFGLGKSHSSGGNTSGVAFGVPFSVSGLDNKIKFLKEFNAWFI